MAGMAKDARYRLNYLFYHQASGLRFKDNQKKEQTSRYDIRPARVLKMQNSGHYQAISPTETKNLLDATQLYQKRIMSELYDSAA